MSSLWTPEGNKNQTQIDIEIARLRREKRNLRLELRAIYEALTIAEYEIDDIVSIIDEIRSGDHLIISLAAFKGVLSKKKILIHDQERWLVAAEEIEARIEVLDRFIEELLKKREEAKTKILEFRIDRPDK